MAMINIMQNVMTINVMIQTSIFTVIAINTASNGHEQKSTT